MPEEIRLVNEIIQCLRWKTADVLWKDADWIWSKCKHIPIETGAGISTGRPVLIEPYTPWAKDIEKKKRLIRLICKYKNETYDETKEVKNIKIKVEDVNLVIKSVLNIDLNIKEILTEETHV